MSFAADMQILCVFGFLSIRFAERHSLYDTQSGLTLILRKTKINEKDNADKNVLLEYRRKRQNNNSFSVINKFKLSLSIVSAYRPLFDNIGK